PLAVDAAGHLGFALDVDDAAAADVGTRRNPARRPERIVPELQDGQAVDLPGHRPLRIDEDLALGDHFPDLLLEQVGPVGLLLDRSADMLPGDRGAPGLA